MSMTSEYDILKILNDQYYETCDYKLDRYLYVVVFFINVEENQKKYPIETNGYKINCKV